MNEPKTIKITKIGFNIIIIAVLLYFLFVVNIFPWLFSILINITNPIALAVTLLAILFGIMLFVLTRQVVAEEFNGTIEQSEAIAGFIFLSPNLLGFLLFFAGPLIFSLYVSLTDWDALGTKNFIGIENYQSIFSLTIKGLKEKTQAASDVIDITKYDELGRINLFGKYFLIGAKDKLFWIALRNTLLFGLMTVPLTVSLSLLLATILNSEVPGVKIFRVLYFIPSIAAVVGIAIIWSWLLHGSIGFVNWAITNIVNFLNVIPFVNIVDPKINWLSDSATALFSIVIMSVWQTMGFNTVLFLTGLQGISGSLYEAATIDGANNVDKFWRITIPMLAPTTFFVISTSTIQALQLFEQVFIATGFDPGGPNNATLSIVLYLYKKGFRWFQSGYASATAWVLFFLIFLITVFQYRYQKRLEENF
jgi:ABC-type sugar transport system permease subunit